MFIEKAGGGGGGGGGGRGGDLAFTFCVSNVYEEVVSALKLNSFRS